MSSSPATPKPDPRAWRALMTARELAAYDLGKYESPRTVPRESLLVSRDKRLTTYRDTAISKAGQASPEEQASTSEIIRALDVIASISRPCVICGARLLGKGEDRAAVMSGGRVYLYCQPCFDAFGLKLEVDDWFSKLQPLDQKVWHLLQQGLTQPGIAARLTNGDQRITQQIVSQSKLRVEKLIRESRQQKKYVASIQ